MSGSPRRLQLARRLLALAQCSGDGSGSARAAARAATTAATARASPPTAAIAAAARSPTTNILLPLAARPFAKRTSSLGAPTLPARRLTAAASFRALRTSAARRAAAEASPSPEQGSKPTPWGQKSPLSFNSMVAGLAVFLGIVAFAQGTADKRVGDMMKKSQQVAGKAAVGGPFKLIDTRGKPFTNANLLGEFALLYFGFTHCPDICPDELEKVAEAVDEVERTTGAQVVPVFISVDPKRDTPQRVATYVREFHPRMIGLTGSEQAVTDAAKAYRVYFSRTDGGGGSGSGGATTSPSSSVAENDDYLVDHSIITYLIDPKGEFVTFYGKNFDAKQLADSIGGHVMAWAEKDEKFLARLACKMPNKEEEGKEQK